MIANDIAFNNYLEEKTQGCEKFYHDYLGINRKEFPKWQGWKIINDYKDQGVNIKTIDDRDLLIHVENFYYLKLIQEVYY